MQDWCLTKRGFDGYTCVKAKLIRPYMEDSNEWELIEHLRGDDPNSDSVGLVLYQWKGREYA